MQWKLNQKSDCPRSGVKTTRTDICKITDTVEYVLYVIFFTICAKAAVGVDSTPILFRVKDHRFSPIVGWVDYGISTGKN